MGIVNVRNTVRAHLFRERFEVLLAVLVPLLFMVESGYANAWIFAGGHLGLDFSSLMAYGRGFALEAFTFVCFRLVRGFFGKGGWLIAVLPLLIGLIAMIVSAGMNLGWMAQSGEIATVMDAVSAYMPGLLASIFRLGLGLLFPLGVGLFALFDVRHLIDEMIASAHLDDRAMVIHRAEMHRGLYIKSMKRAKRGAAGQYDDICAVDAENMAKAVRSGDLSFGASAATRMSQPATKVTPVAPSPLLSAPQRPAALPVPAPAGVPSMPPLAPKLAARP